MTARSRTSLALDDLLESAPSHWAIAAPPGSEPRRWLTLLTDAVRHEADLSAYGQFLTRSDLLRSASAMHALAAAGDPSRATVEGPAIVIGGLPRTATTMLHALAATAPGAWVPRTWEYEHPSLIGEVDAARRAAAVTDSAQRLAGFARLVPDFDAIHPMAADAPEECDVLLAHRFESFRTLIHYDVPTYRAAWLASAHTGPYQLLATVLRRATGGLPRDEGPPVPVLKAPGHLHGYEALRRRVPSALIVQVYRPVRDIITSWIDLVRASRSAFSSSAPRREALLDEWVGVFSAMVDRGLAARAASPEGWLGLRYDELVSAPEPAWHDVVSAACADHLRVVRGSTAPAPSRTVDRSLPRAQARAVDELDERYRRLVFGE